MVMTLTMLLILIILPLCAFILEIFLYKKSVKYAQVFPLIIACFFIFTGIHALIIAAITYTIYFVMNYLKKEKHANLSEIEKMNIQDLD